MNMREQENIDLVKRLRTRQPYKHALEIMADDLTQWLRDESVHDGDIFEHSIILGQGDYPSGRDIIGNAVRKMNEAADAIEALQVRVAELETEAERRDEQIRDMIEASGQTCACGYDKASDICLGHLSHFRKSVATARRDAFEEAAKVADHIMRDYAELTYSPHHDRMQNAAKTYCAGEIAAAIRDLAEKG